MSTRTQALNEFLKSTVNLPASSLDALETHVDALWGVLLASEHLKDPPLDWQQQGSWAYGTIIKPPKGQDFDADVVLESPHLHIEPKEYLLRINQALSRHGTYRDKTQLKSRCVRVAYAGEHHVDLVPLVRRATGSSIVNRLDNRFEAADPVGYADWFNERDAWAGGHLHKVVRLLKYLRDSKQTHSTKSVILTTLLGQCVRQGDDFSDTVEALWILTQRLATELARFVAKPSLPDPSCPGATFDHRWTQQEFETLKTVVRSIERRIGLAVSAGTPAQATTAWRDLFGDAFPEITTLAPARMSDLEVAPNEQHANQLFRIAVRYQAVISTEVRPTTGRRRAKNLGRDGIVERHRELTFRVRTTAPVPFEVFWKVRNRGSEAAAAGALRGEIEAGGMEHQETTLYRGRHRIEVYIVQNGTVVASASQLVTIR